MSNKKDTKEVGCDGVLAVDPVKVSPAHGKFAEAVANLADAYGMSKFVMTYKPDWQKHGDTDQRINGDMTIRYEAKDGRGRPSRELKITCESTTTISVISEPKSFS